jgi:hypothetical protein
MAANAGFKDLLRVLPPEILTLHLDTGSLNPVECCSGSMHSLAARRGCTPLHRSRPTGCK